MCGTDTGHDLAKGAFGEPARQIVSEHAALAGDYENQPRILTARPHKKPFQCAVSLRFPKAMQIEARAGLDASAPQSHVEMAADPGGMPLAYDRRE